MKTAAEIAREAGVLSGYDSDLFKRFAALVRADERESTAKFFDGKVGQADLRDIAAAIREMS